MRLLFFGLNILQTVETHINKNIGSELIYSELIEELKNIRYETPWEGYSNKLRATIGSSVSQSFNNNDSIVTITSPTNSKIEKYKVFDTATEFMIGESAEYLKPFEKN